MEEEGFTFFIITDAEFHMIEHVTTWCSGKY
jgi:hypothetical protein